MSAPSSELPAQAGKGVAAAPTTAARESSQKPPSIHGITGTGASGSENLADRPSEARTGRFLLTGRSSHRGAALFGAALACVITANSVHRVKNTKTGEITVLRRVP